MKRAFTSLVKFALLVALSFVPTFVSADDMPWAEYDETTRTLTFRYDSNYESCSNKKYTLNKDKEEPAWLYIGFPDYESDSDTDESADDELEKIEGVETVVFDSSFASARPTTCYCWFSAMVKLKKIEGLQYLNTSEVTDMSKMFYGVLKMQSIDLRGLDTKNVTDMSYMFSDCVEARSLDLSTFDTSNVTDMSNMFYACDSLATLDVSNFNTAKVTDMSSMFTYCRSLKSLDLSAFRTQNVTTMETMFYGMGNLTSLDLSNFDTSSVTDMISMFKLCSLLTELDLSSFNTKKLKSMENMFNDSPLEVIYVGEGFDVSNASGSYIFGNCKFPNYDESKTGRSMANYTDGYLTLRRHFTVGDKQYNADGTDPVCKDLVEIEDKEVFSSDFTFTFADDGAATYYRKVSSSWSTLCLPFQFDASRQANNFQFFEISDVGSDAIKANEITGEVEAGKPVLVYTTFDSIFVMGKENTKVVLQPVSDDNMVGSFTEATVDNADGNYFISKDKFWSVSSILSGSKAENIKMAPYRAYIKTAGGNAKATSLDIVTDETDGISDTDTADSGNILDGAVLYDAQGQRLNAPVKGLVIVRKGNQTWKMLFQ